MSCPYMYECTRICFISLLFSPLFIYRYMVVAYPFLIVPFPCYCILEPIVLCASRELEEWEIGRLPSSGFEAKGIQISYYLRVIFPTSLLIK